MRKYSNYEDICDKKKIYNKNNKIGLENKIYKKIIEESGSITSMVTVTIIFFITILSSTYMLMAVQRKSQLKSQLSTREAYQEEIDNANEIYYTLIGDDASVNIKEEYEENTYTNKNVYVYSRNNKKFSVNKDESKIATDQSSYVLTEDGTYTIAINKDNELEEHIVKIDKTQPIINNIEISDVTSNSFKIKVNAEDTLSGIKQIRYSVDGGKNLKVPTENITECTITDIDPMFTEYQIEIEAEDMAGNDIIKEQTQTALLSEMQIGDYVAYTPSSANNYTLTSTFSGYTSNQTITQDATLKWRVLNIDKENKTIDIVSSEPTSNSVYFSGALGYNNGVYLLNEICEKLYSNSNKNIKARSISLEDMEKHLTDAGFTGRNAYVYNNDAKNYAKYGTTKTYTTNKLYPKLYANQIGAGINTTNVTSPNIIKTIDPYKESRKGYVALTTETTDTAGSNGLTVTQTYYNIAINELNYGTAGMILSNSNWYWVASRFVTTRLDYADFGLRLANTNMYGNSMLLSSGTLPNYKNCLRPLVSLQSSILTGEKDSNKAWIIN